MTGSGTVKIEGKPVVRVGDMDKDGAGQHHWRPNGGKVFVENKAVIVVGNQDDYSNQAQTGSPTVSIG